MSICEECKKSTSGYCDKHLLNEFNMNTHEKKPSEIIEQKIEELYDKYSQTPVHDRIVDVENTGIITGRIPEWKGKTMKDELLPLFKEAILYGQQTESDEVRIKIAECILLPAKAKRLEVDKIEMDIYNGAISDILSALATSSEE